MRPILNSALVLAIGISAAGCGEHGLHVEGRLLKGGKPLLPGEGESVSITFVPVLERGERSSERGIFAAALDPEDGTFVAKGPHDQGVSPGKYLVALKLKKGRKDLWEGRFDVENSPFVFDVDEGSEEIVIDMDKPPASGIAQQPVVAADVGG